MKPSGRLYAFDAMRGLAALAVIFYHFCTISCSVQNHGYLAVDFFFILSGFVINRTYANALAGQLTFLTFLSKRILRLWPLFILGLGLALAKALVQSKLGTELHAPKLIIMAFFTEAVFIPTHALGRELFPLNGPAWSLFFELVVNIVFALGLYRARTSRLVIVSILCALFMAYGVWLNGTLNIGWSWTFWWAGLARALFGFVAGMILSRLSPPGVITVSWTCLIPLCLLTLALTLPVDPHYTEVYDLGVALVLSPLLILAAGHLQAPKALRSLFGTLGDISYPVYATHFPLMFLWALIATKMGLAKDLWAPFFVVEISLLAYLLNRYYQPTASLLLLNLASFFIPVPAIKPVSLIEDAIIQPTEPDKKIGRP